MINPGEFNEKIKILALNLIDSTYQWTTSTEIWAKAERFNSNRISAILGPGKKSVKFIMRKCSISLNSAILWDEEYCLLTDVVEVDRMYYEVTAIITELKTCVAAITSTRLNSLNRPVTSSISTLTFPACMLEKYTKNSQSKPMIRIEMHYILVVPAAIELEVGGTIEIEDTTYEVWATRFLSVYKNEYEIRIRGDA